MRKRSVSVRIMWSDELDKDFATEIAEIICEALKKRGLKTDVSKIYRNRDNTGGRIYITIERKRKTKSDRGKSSQ